MKPKKRMYQRPLPDPEFLRLYICEKCQKTGIKSGMNFRNGKVLCWKCSGDKY